MMYYALNTGPLELLQVFKSNQELFLRAKELSTVARLPHYRGTNFWVMWASTFVNNWVTLRVPTSAS